MIQVTLKFRLAFNYYENHVIGLMNLIEKDSLETCMNEETK